MPLTIWAYLLGCILILDGPCKSNLKYQISKITWFSSLRDRPYNEMHSLASGGIVT